LKRKFNRVVQGKISGEEMKDRGKVSKKKKGSSRKGSGKECPVGREKEGSSMIDAALESRGEKSSQEGKRRFRDVPGGPSYWERLKEAKPQQ